MEDWQQANNRRLRSITVQQDHGSYSCIAFTEPLDDQEYYEDEQEYYEDEQEYDVDEFGFDAYGTRIVESLREALRERAASRWKLVSATSFFNPSNSLHGDFFVYLFWHRTAS